MYMIFIFSEWFQVSNIVFKSGGGGGVILTYLNSNRKGEWETSQNQENPKLWGISVVYVKYVTSISLSIPFLYMVP